MRENADSKGAQHHPAYPQNVLSAISFVQFVLTYFGYLMWMRALSPVLARTGKMTSSPTFGCSGYAGIWNAPCTLLLPSHHSFRLFPLMAKCHRPYS